MIWPTNIASKLAKLKAKKEKLTKEIAKLDTQITELEAKA